MSHHSFSTYTNWWSGKFFRDLFPPVGHLKNGILVSESSQIPMSSGLGIILIWPESLLKWKVSLLNLLLSKHLDGP